MDRKDPSKLSLVLDEVRLDIQITTFDGRVVRPILTVVMSEEPIESDRLISFPFLPMGRGLIEGGMRSLRERITAIFVAAGVRADRGGFHG